MENAPHSTALRALKKGEYIKRTATAKAVYVKGEYVPSMRAYECHAFDDICKTIFIKSEKPVFFGFTF